MAKPRVVTSFFGRVFYQQPMMMALPGNRDSRISPAKGSFAITGRSQRAIWIFPRRLPLQKRAARRVDQSNSPCRSAEHLGRDTDCLPVLFRGLCSQRKPRHAVLHGTDRSFSETHRLSVALARCPCSLGPRIRHKLTCRYCNRRRTDSIVLLAWRYSTRRFLSSLARRLVTPKFKP